MAITPTGHDLTRAYHLIVGQFTQRADPASGKLLEEVPLIQLQEAPALPETVYQSKIYNLSGWEHGNALPFSTKFEVELFLAKANLRSRFEAARNGDKPLTYFPLNEDIEANLYRYPGAVEEPIEMEWLRWWIHYSVTNFDYPIIAWDF